jgi:hypothetical protein
MSVNPGFDIEDAWSRRDIDMAIGVLIALRRCTERQAFAEIAAAVGRTGVGLHSISRALVALASGTTTTSDHSSAATDLWGDLVGARHGVRASAS